MATAIQPVANATAFALLVRQATSEGLSLGRTNGHLVYRQSAEEVIALGRQRAGAAWTSLQHQYPALIKQFTSNKPLFVELYAGAFAGGYEQEGLVRHETLTVPIRTRQSKAARRFEARAERKPTQLKLLVPEPKAIVVPSAAEIATLDLARVDAEPILLPPAGASSLAHSESIGAVADPPLIVVGAEPATVTGTSEPQTEAELVSLLGTDGHVRVGPRHFAAKLRDGKHVLLLNGTAVTPTTLWLAYQQAQRQQKAFLRRAS